MTNRKIGLALGSGGLRGFAMFPIIKRLKEHKISITAVSGSSIGALIGAYYGLHGEIDSLFRISSALTKTDYLKMADPNKPTKSLFKGEKLKAFLQDKYFGDKTFADTHIPLIICAVDINTNEPVYFRQGLLIDAVMASISIPGVFSPYRVGRHYCIDGGVLDPVPVKPLLDLNLEKILAVNLMGYLPGRKSTADYGLRTTLIATFYLMMSRLSRPVEDSRVFDLTLKFSPDLASALSISKWRECTSIGQKAIDQNISKIQEWLER